MYNFNLKIEIMFWNKYYLFLDYIFNWVNKFNIDLKNNKSFELLFSNPKVL